MSNQQINDISIIDHSTSVSDHFKLWESIIEADKNQLSDTADCLDEHSSKSLNEDDVNNDSDICCCGYDWSRDVKSTPIPDDEVPDYLKRLGEWDTSKITNIENMFGDIKSLTSIPKLHEWDISNVTNLGNMVAGRTSLSDEGKTVDCSLVLIKRGNKYLGVSRKHDHNDIGLPGGKRERGESFEDCARRETTEETDFIITLLRDEPFKGVDMGLYCQTYLAEITGKVSQARDPSETGIVGWFDKQAFIDGTFGEYNTKMFKHFGL